MDRIPEADVMRALKQLMQDCDKVNVIREGSWDEAKVQYTIDRETARPRDRETASERALPHAGANYRAIVSTLSYNAFDYYSLRNLLK